MCDIAVDQDSSVRLLVESSNNQENLWQLKSQPRKFSYLNQSPPMNLQQVLSEKELVRLKDKRVLALTLAFALIQCYGSPCMRETLQRDSIFFCTLMGNNLDFERPFLATQFPNLTSGPVAPNMALQHQNPAILNLGILLLEVHTGRLLKSFFTPEETVKQSANTELLVARRVVEDLEEWCSETYKDAVRACLEVTWVPSGEIVDLGESKTSSGFYEHVIHRLDEELGYLFSLKI